MDAKTKLLAGMIRRCLSARFILRSRNQDLFAQLVQYHEELQSYFRKMGAELVLQDTLGVAYLQSIAEWDDELQYRFGRSRALSAWETLMLIFLRYKRMEFFGGSIDSEVPWVSREELRNYLREYSAETEDRRFEAQFVSTLKSLKEHQVLSTQNDLHFEITPICEVLLDGERLLSLKDRAAKYFSGDEDRSELQVSEDES